jgi:hypothetical protein
MHLSVRLFKDNLPFKYYLGLHPKIVHLYTLKTSSPLVSISKHGKFEFQTLSPTLNNS